MLGDFLLSAFSLKQEPLPGINQDERLAAYKQMLLAWVCPRGRRQLVDEFVDIFNQICMLPMPVV